MLSFVPFVPHDHILDPEIAQVVKVLQDNGVETCRARVAGATPTTSQRWSFMVEWVKGPEHLELLCREWSVINNELTGPLWTMEFNPRLLPVST